MVKNHVRALLSFVCLVASLGMAAKPRLVPISDAAVVTSKSSNPEALTRAGAQIFFLANDAVNGKELWRSDGTVAGTRMVLDLRTGAESSNPRIVGTFGNDVLFRATGDAQGEALWRSNGTAAGTVRLFAFPAPAGGGMSIEVYPAGSRIFIVVQRQSSAPNEIWVSQGAVDDAQRIALVKTASTPAPLGVNGKLYFIAADAILGSQFWVSDGTVPGTHMVQQGVTCPGNGDPCGPRPVSFFTAGAQALFGANDGLWKTDGTPAGTARIVAMDSAPFGYASSPNAAYFFSVNSLWKTNGTALGTTFVMSTNSVIGVPQILDDGRLVFAASFGPFSFQYWRTDGTPGGTQAFSPVPVGDGLLGNLGTRVFVSGKATATGTELWLANVDAGPAALLKDLESRINEGGVAMSSLPGAGATLGSQFLFAATDIHGRELWTSDGTAAGTKLLANIASEPGGGFVSGTVLESGSGREVAGAMVRLCTTICEAPVLTDAAGRYRFESVIPGTYKVLVSHPAYVSQLYTGIDCAPLCPISSGTPIQVTSGFETTNVDFSITRGGTISGHVTRASTGEPIHTEVFILYSNGDTAQVLFPDSFGVYRSKGLPAGTYFVHSSLAPWGDPPLIDRLFRSVDCFPDETCESYAGEPVTVTSGAETSGIDLALHEFGRIGGTVRDASTNLGIPNAQVNFRLAGETFSSISVKADENGVYLSPLIYPGAYRVFATSDGFTTTNYPAAVCNGQDCGTVVNAAIDTTTSDIDIMMEPLTQRLTGIIRTSDGVPAVNVHVALVDEQGEFAGFSTSTDDKGRYTLDDMQPGTYYLTAHEDLIPNLNCDSFPCNVAGATPLTITALTTTPFDAQIRARYTTISGQLLDAVTGTGIPIGAKATLFNSTQSPIQHADATETGNYTMTVLSRSSSFFVSATSPAHHTTAYPTGEVVTATLPASATPITPGTHTGIDITLEPYGTISGKVFFADTGSPAQAPMAVYFQRQGTTSPFLNVPVESDGSYRFTRAQGSYYVYAQSVESGYKGQVFPLHDCNGDCVATVGDLITVGNRQNVTNIDFHLQPKVPTGRITGRVVDHLTSAALANATVTVTDGTTSLSTFTDGQGFYAFEGMPSGTYRLSASAALTFVSVFGGPTCTPGMSCNVNAGTGVVVQAPDTTANIDFRLTRPTLTNVTPASGTILGNTQITINGTNFTPQTTVTVGGSPASVVSVTPTQIVARTPTGVEGLAHVTLKMGTLAISLPHAFNYTPVVFTDANLTVGVTRIKKAHITELRDAINSLRATASLPAATFTDPSLTGVKIRAVHLLELRTALNQARAALGRSTLTYANPLTVGSPIRAIDVTELRNGIR